MWQIAAQRGFALHVGTFGQRAGGDGSSRCGGLLDLHDRAQPSRGKL